MIGFRLFRSQMPSLLLYALFPRVKQKELTSFTIESPLAKIFASISSLSLGGEMRKLIVGYLCTPLILLSPCCSQSPIYLQVPPAYWDINANKYLVLFRFSHALTVPQSLMA